MYIYLSTKILILQKREALGVRSFSFYKPHVGIDTLFYDSPKRALPLQWAIPQLDKLLNLKTILVQLKRAS